MSLGKPNTRSKSCPICGEVFVTRLDTRKRVLNTKVRRHLKREHHDYYTKARRWNLSAVVYFIFGGDAMLYLFGGVCSRYGNDCGPPIIREGISSPFFPVALAIFILPFAVLVQWRWRSQEKFRSEWQATHGQTGITDDKDTHASATSTSIGTDLEEGPH
jgi:hypothetical protein